jgi:hypothetical protein
MSFTSPGRLATIAFAAAATVAAIGVLPHGSADAKRPVYDNRDEVSRLRAENAQLRSDLRAYQTGYDLLSDAISRVDRINSRSRDRRTQRDIQRTIERARRDAGPYIGNGDDGGYDGGYNGGYDGSGTPGGYPNYPQGERRYQMPANQLNGLVARVRDASFADDQLALVREAAQLNWFSVAQVVALMKACSFEDTRIEIAVTLYPRIIDPQSWYTVYDAFDFSSSKQTLRQRTGQPAQP